MSFNIVLIEPEIPNNTGNIGRLALATGSHLHLVKPLGFKLDDKHLKRSGLDYWKHLEVTTYENAHAFFSIHKNKKFIYFSSHGNKRHWDINFSEMPFLVFGKESVGLSEKIITREKCYKIPLYNEHIRSLNLANAVSVVVYEGLRQLHN